MDILYSTQATAVGGRDGWVGSVDGALKVKLSMPEALGGLGGQGSNPEQLFAAAYAACLLQGVRAAAVRAGLELPGDANVTATVGVRRVADDPGMVLEISMAADLAGLESATAQALVAEAHALCPYSRALREAIEVRLRIT